MPEPYVIFFTFLVPGADHRVMVSVLVFCRFNVSAEFLDELVSCGFSHSILKSLQLLLEEVDVLVVPQLENVGAGLPGDPSRLRFCWSFRGPIRRWCIDSCFFGFIDRLLPHPIFFKNCLYIMRGG